MKIGQWVCWFGADRIIRQGKIELFDSSGLAIIKQKGTANRAIVDPASLYSSLEQATKQRGK